MPANLINYLPDIYKGILEFNEIARVENISFDEFQSQVDKVFNNQFVLTMDEEGIKQYESRFGIKANMATESLEFRRQRILNRLVTAPPFTFNYLKGRLNEILGPGKWNAYIDYENFTLYLESSASNQGWFHEVQITMNQIKPAAIVFINKPLLSGAIDITEEVRYGSIIYNYRLGVSWTLGSKPFISLEDKGLIKMPSTPSLTKDFLDSIASFSLGEVVSVLINDNLSINDLTKTVEGNIGTIEYIIPDESVEEITNIKLLDSESNVLTESSVYIPVLTGTHIKHTILVREGE